LLTGFQNFFTAGKLTKFATKDMKYSQPHLACFAALPWEARRPDVLKVTKELNFKKLKYRTMCDEKETLHVMWLNGY